MAPQLVLVDEPGSSTTCVALSNISSGFHFDLDDSIQFKSLLYIASEKLEEWLMQWENLHAICPTIKTPHTKDIAN